MTKPAVNTLFLIDDDEIYLFTMKKIIEKNKLVSNVHEFHNGFDAIDFLNKMSTNNHVLLPDIILLDINMPIMDGWTFMELFSLLKPKLNKKITVYMISSSINKSDIDRAKSISDISDFIVKPIGSEQLKNLFLANAA
jgi:CheY-like chemotaxis protein